MFDDIFADEGAALLPPELVKAIAAMPDIDPFFAAMINGLVFEANESIPVMATDCVGKLFYNPKALREEPRKWGAATLAGVLAHECMHILRLDAEFLKGADHQIANIAADAVINRALTDSGFTFPQVRFADPEDKSANAANAYDDPTIATGYATNRSWPSTPVIYDAVYKIMKKKQQQRDSSDMGGDIDLPSYEAAKAAAGGADEVEQIVRQRARTAAAQAEQMARDMGKTVDKPAPGAGGNEEDSGAPEGEQTVSSGWGLEDSAASTVLEGLGILVRKPSVKLMRVAGAKVRGILKSKTRRQRSMLMPSPMSIAQGRIVAGSRRAMDYRIAVAIDCSGSISRDRLMAFTAAAHAWCQQFASRSREIQVCYWNTKIKFAAPMSTLANGDAVPDSSGGTGFKPVLRWCRDLANKPTHLIVFTDLDFEHPKNGPDGIETLWVVPPCDMRKKVNFGTKIELDV